MYYTRYESKIAPIILVGDEDGLMRLHFDIADAKMKLNIENDWEYNDEFFDDVKNEIDEYFLGNRKDFTIKLNPKGTEYQKRVWEQLRKIPYGQVCTYKELAQKMGSPNASRAVGNANGKNPIPLIVPCHRVIGANNKLTGFAYGLDLKRKLIELEKDNS